MVRARSRVRNQTNPLQEVVRLRKQRNRLLEKLDQCGSVTTLSFCSYLVTPPTSTLLPLLNHPPSLSTGPGKFYYEIVLPSVPNHQLREFKIFGEYPIVCVVDMFEREKERKAAAHRRALMRKESEISEWSRRIREMKARLPEEGQRLQAASIEFTDFQRIRQAAVALNVWQPQVVYGRQKQIIKQNDVSC